MKLRDIGRTALLTAACASMFAVATPSYAALISGLFIPGTNELSDLDVERVVGADGAVKTGGSFAIGDTIQTLLRFEDANLAPISDTYGAPYQLNAYAELKISSIVNLGNGFSNIVFAPSGTLGTNVFANLYERTGAQPGYSSGIAAATAIGNVKSETLIAQLGLKEADDFWFATVPTSNGISAVAGAVFGDPQAAIGEFGLSILTDAGGLSIIPNGITGFDGNLHDIVGNASAYARSPGVNTGWLVSSNTTVDFTVPEPTVLSLAGLALIAGGIAGRRRKTT
jgi:hypothetical protein